jgi:hypothetical protein
MIFFNQAQYLCPLFTSSFASSIASYTSKSTNEIPAGKQEFEYKYNNFYVKANMDLG